MSIIKETAGDTVILTEDQLSLNGDEAAELKRNAVELIQSGVRRISLNLYACKYMDSSGIGKLLFLNKKLQQLEGEFKIIKINQTLYDFLESLAITKVVDVAMPE